MGKYPHLGSKTLGLIIQIRKLDKRMMLPDRDRIRIGYHGPYQTTLGLTDQGYRRFKFAIFWKVFCSG